MQKVKKIGNSILFGGIIFLLFLVAFESFIQIPSWLAVAGRMHPMFLHFPIVLLLISFFTIWSPAGRDGDNEWLDLLPTMGGFTRLPPAELAELLAAVGSVVDSLGGAFTMPYATVAVTARRGDVG